MVLNLEFRNKLEKMLKDEVSDHKIIAEVLEFAWLQYPRPLLIWFIKKMQEWDQFGGE